MNKYLKLLVLVLFISLINGCETTNPDGPDTDIRDKFVGTWIFSESTPNRGINATYDVVISKDPSNSSQVLLTNFSAVGSGANPAYGIVTTNSITVPLQTIATDYKVEGSGSLSNSSTMNWSYSYTTGADKTNCTATATKQ
jgi:hypothetical protein